MCVLIITITLFFHLFILGYIDQNSDQNLKITVYYMFEVIFRVYLHYVLYIFISNVRTYQKLTFEIKISKKC